MINMELQNYFNSKYPDGCHVPRMMDESDRNFVKIFYDNIKNAKHEGIFGKALEFCKEMDRYLIEQYEYMFKNNILFVPEIL